MQTYNGTARTAGTFNNNSGTFTLAFPELSFMRLIVWKDGGDRKQSRDLLDMAIYQRCVLPFMPGVSIEFCEREGGLSQAGAAAMAGTMSSLHSLDTDELFAIEEAISSERIDPLVHEDKIDHAEVGDLNGRATLAIQWTDKYRDCKRISLFYSVSADCSEVHEIHFSAPIESFEMAKKYFTEALRSIQWCD